MFAPSAGTHTRPPPPPTLPTAVAGQLYTEPAGLGAQWKMSLRLNRNICAACPPANGDPIELVERNRNASVRPRWG